MAALIQEIHIQPWLILGTYYLGGRYLDSHLMVTKRGYSQDICSQIGYSKIKSFILMLYIHCKHEAKKKVCRRGNTVNFIQTTKWLDCHLLNICLRSRTGIVICYVYCLCIQSQVYGFIATYVACCKKVE